MTKNKLDRFHDHIILAYRNGTVLTELAKSYEVSTGTIRNLLISYDEPLRKRGRKPNGTDKQTNQRNPI